MLASKTLNIVEALCMSWSFYEMVLVQNDLCVCVRISLLYTLYEMVFLRNDCQSVSGKEDKIIQGSDTLSFIHCKKHSESSSPWKHTMLNKQASEFWRSNVPQSPLSRLSK